MTPYSKLKKQPLMVDIISSLNFSLFLPSLFCALKCELNLNNAPNSPSGVDEVTDKTLIRDDRSPTLYTVRLFSNFFFFLFFFMWAYFLPSLIQMSQSKRIIPLLCETENSQA